MSDFAPSFRMAEAKPKTQDTDAAVAMLMLCPEAQQPSTSGTALFGPRKKKIAKYETVEERKDAKKKQNREAAARYRAKRSGERKHEEKALEELEKKNLELRERRAYLQAQIQVLRQRLNQFNN